MGEAVSVFRGVWMHQRRERQYLFSVVGTYEKMNRQERKIDVDLRDLGGFINNYFFVSNIFSISSITRFIFFIVRSNGSEVVISTPAFFNNSIG